MSDSESVDSESSSVDGGNSLQSRKADVCNNNANLVWTDRCRITGKLKVYVMSVISGAYQFKEEKRLQHMVLDSGTRLRLAVPLGTSVFKTERVVQGFGDGGPDFISGFKLALEQKFPDLQKLDEEFEIVDFPLPVPCHPTIEYFKIIGTKSLKKVHIVLEAKERARVYHAEKSTEYIDESDDEDYRINKDNLPHTHHTNPNRRHANPYMQSPAQPTKGVHLYQQPQFASMSNPNMVRTQPIYANNGKGNNDNFLDQVDINPGDQGESIGTYFNDALSFNNDGGATSASTYKQSSSFSSYATPQKPMRSSSTKKSKSQSQSRSRDSRNNYRSPRTRSRSHSHSDSGASSARAKRESLARSSSRKKASRSGRHEQSRQSDRFSIDLNAPPKNGLLRGQVKVEDNEGERESMHGMERLQKKVTRENQVSGKKHRGENDRDIYTTEVSFTEDDGDEEEETQSYYMSPLAESQFGANEFDSTFEDDDEEYDEDL